MDYSLVGFAAASGTPIPLLLATDPGAAARLHDLEVRQAGAGNLAALDFLSGTAHIMGYPSAQAYYADAGNPAAAPGALVGVSSVVPPIGQVAEALNASPWVVPVVLLGAGLLAWRLF